MKILRLLRKRLLVAYVELFGVLVVIVLVEVIEFFSGDSYRLQVAVVVVVVVLGFPLVGFMMLDSRCMSLILRFSGFFKSGL